MSEKTPLTSKEAMEKPEFKEFLRQAIIQQKAKELNISPEEVVKLDEITQTPEFRERMREAVLKNRSEQLGISPEEVARLEEISKTPEAIELMREAVIRHSGIPPIKAGNATLSESTLGTLLTATSEVDGLTISKYGTKEFFNNLPEGTKNELKEKMSSGNTLKM